MRIAKVKLLLNYVYAVRLACQTKTKYALPSFQTFYVCVCVCV